MNTENLMPYGKLRQKNQRLNRTGQKKNPGRQRSKNSNSVSEPQKIKYWKKEFDLVELFYSFADAWSPPSPPYHHTVGPRFSLQQNPSHTTHGSSSHSRALRSSPHHGNPSAPLLPPEYSSSPVQYYPQ